jgi:hypothetical protein
MIFHSPLLNILINLVSVGKYNFLNWGTFVPQGTVYGVFLMGTVPGLITIWARGGKMLISTGCDCGTLEKNCVRSRTLISLRKGSAAICVQVGAF